MGRGHLHLSLLPIPGRLNSPQGDGGGCLPGRDGESRVGVIILKRNFIEKGKNYLRLRRREILLECLAMEPIKNEISQLKNKRGGDTMRSGRGGESP